ncbi:MAG: hypothetical protein HQ581_18875 [Planctomycetes bacterium]|nr:hypothetical protein [Planctomycetota bacterium]
MKVHELIDALKQFDPEAEVHLGIGLPGGTMETHRRIWVGDHGDGPQINTALDPRGFLYYVGSGLAGLLTKAVRPPAQRTPPAQRDADVDLGQYADEETTARVRDFYVVHHNLSEPLRFPDFDYQRWIPPRTVSGKYNEEIARILEEKLLGD